MNIKQSSVHTYSAWTYNARQTPWCRGVRAASAQVFDLALGRHSGAIGTKAKSEWQVFYWENKDTHYREEGPQESGPHQLITTHPIHTA